jgi:hypothetical protein
MFVFLYLHAPLGMLLSWLCVSCVVLYLLYWYCFIIDGERLKANTFPILTWVTTNVGNDPHVRENTHLHVSSRLQRHATVHSEGCFWWNVRWLPSVQTECEDFLHKLRLSLHSTDNNQGVWSRVTVMANSLLKLFCPHTHSAVASRKHELCVK